MAGKRTRNRNFNVKRLCVAARKEAVLAFSNAIVVTASTLLVLSALRAMNSEAQTANSVNNNLPLTDVQRLYEDIHLSFNNTERRSYLIQEIHDSFEVPYRFLDNIGAENLDRLLSNLRTHAHTILVPLKKRVAFASIKGHSVAMRIQALASVAAYASMTGRVPVVLWHIHEGFEIPFDTVLQWACRTDCPPIIVNDVLDRDILLREENRTGRGKTLNVDAPSTIDLSNHVKNYIAKPARPMGDWAELSMHEIYSDISTLTRTRTISKRQKLPRGQRQVRKLSEEKTVSPTSRVHKSRDYGISSVASTLNLMAPRDKHIALTIPGSIRSRYSSLIDSEQILQSCLRAKTQAAEQLISSAHLTITKLADIDDSRVMGTLHDHFQIPFVLLQALQPVMQRMLLDRLMRKKKQGHFAPRTIWVQPQFGLGNRLRALGSAMAFARETGRVLVLIWVPDAHTNCLFRDLFVGHDDILVSDSFHPQDEWPFLSMKSRDVAMHAVDWYNYMRVNGVHMTNPSDFVLDNPTRHIYVSTAYVIQSPVIPGIVRTQSSYWKVLRTLTPHISVARIVQTHLPNFSASIMGVHIRGRSIKTDISGVGISEYSEEASRRTDYWRNLTGVAAFITEMRRQNKTQFFYIAADQKDVLDRVESEFPGRVYYTPRECDSRSRECLPYALADILLLAKCSSIRGSYWSSFSELSCRWGGARFLLAGVDFGRPKNHTRRKLH